MVDKLYKFNRIVRMKLVLKFKEEVKLYTSALDFQDIVNFACKEFNISPDSLHVSFLDEDNDDITILSNEDIEVMQAVFEGKQYVKVNVVGQLNPPAERKIEEVNAKEQIRRVEKVEEVEEVEEVKHDEVQIELVEEKIEEPAVASEEKPEQPNSSCEQKRQRGHHQWRERSLQKMECYLNQTVAKLVDERLKALIPCLKEQILNHQSKKIESKGIVHEGIECKGCLLKPIVGVRYECPTCPEFNLCEACEVKIDHDHNLLKIKKIVEKKEEDERRGLHCLRKFFKHHGHEHHGHHGRSSSQSKDNCHWKGPHWYKRKCWGLSIMFGGKPEDYSSFVEENGQLKPRETFRKYAYLQKMSEQEFRQRFIDMRCQKLSSAFGKPAQEFKSFVEENYESRYRDLVHRLEDRGEKSLERKCGWGGKRFNFNENQEKECSFKKEEVEVKPEKVEEPKKEQLKKQEPKEENNSFVVTDSLLIEPKSESPEVRRQKGNILIQMQEIFGKENSSQYFKFIDLHFKQGLEGIIQRWIQHINLSQISK